MILNKTCFIFLTVYPHKGHYVDFADQDITVIAGALKLFLKELPNPLIPCSVFLKLTPAESEHFLYSYVTVFSCVAIANKIAN